MKRFDFSKTGGFPLSQNRADWMQEAYLGGINAIGSLCGGTDMVVLAGVELTSGTWNAGTVSDGWVWHPSFGVMPFVGGNVNLNAFVTVNDIKTSLTFKNNSSQLVEINRIASIYFPNPLPLQGTSVNQLSGRKWFAIFGKQGRDQIWTPIGPVTHSNYGTVSFEYKKDDIGKLLKLRGTVTANANVQSPYGWQPLTLPAGYIPTADIDFVGAVQRLSTGYPTTNAGVPIRSMNGRILTNGGFQIAFEPNANAYTAKFNCVLNLD